MNGFPTQEEVAAAARKVGEDVGRALEKLPDQAAKIGDEIANIPAAWKKYLDRH